MTSCDLVVFRLKGIGGPPNRAKIIIKHRPPVVRRAGFIFL